MMLAMLTLCAVAGQSRAEDTAQVRTALLIGNAAYPDSESALPTPIGDVRILSEALKARGFAIQTAENLTKKKMEAAIQQFLGTVQPGSIALIFFGGHGIQVGNRNYLIPVDARIWNEADILRDGVSLDKIMSGMTGHGAAAAVAVIDASRRNPFERRFRSVSAGLSPTAATMGTLSLFSAAPGTIANDDEAAGANSLFVAELVKQIAVATSDVEQAFGACRDAVARRTRNQQNPTLVSGLDTAFMLDPSRKPTAVAAVDAPTPPPEPPATPVQEAAPTPPAEQVAKIEPPPPVIDPIDPPPSPPAPPAKPVVALPAPPAADKPQAVEKPQAPEQPQVAEKPQAVENRQVPEKSQVAALPPVSPPVTPDPAPLVAVRIPYSSAELTQKAALDHRVSRDQNDEDAYFERGKLFAEHGDYQLALSDFDRSISLNPGNPETLNNRCWTRAVENQLETAMVDCNDALRLRPNFADAHDSRGLVLLKLGSNRAAVADYDAALKLNPKHSSALYGRGIAKLRLGNSDEAQRDFAAALGLDSGIDQDYGRYGLK